MTHIRKLVLLSDIFDVRDHGNKVLTMSLYVKIEEISCVMYWMKVPMPHGVPIAPEITEPDIVISLSYNKRWCLLSKVNDPLVSRVAQSMLE